jgi:hypothetical protein
MHAGAASLALAGRGEQGERFVAALLEQRE